MTLRTAVLTFAILILPNAALAQSAVLSTSEADNQREFASGVAAMFAGRYNEAAATFDDLAKHTDAPRVKLELGRSLFLAKRYQEAKRAFNEVYYSPGLPYEVRRSINVYLEKVDRKIGFFIPTLGLSIDSNPAKGTSSTDFLLFGVPVVLAQHERGRAFGLQYGLSGRTPINRSSTISVLGSVNGIKYAQSPNSFFNGNAAFSFDDKTQRFSLESGVQYFRRENSDTLISPYTSVTYRLNSTSLRPTDFTGIVSYSSFKYNSYLNGPAVQVGVRHVAPLSKATTLITGAHASIARTNDRRYDQIEAGVSASIYRTLKAVAADIVLSGSVGQRNFAENDPLFGAIRRDTDIGAEIRILRTKPIRRLFPSVGLRYERRKSSLPFYSYAGAGFTTDLFYRF